MEHFYAKYQAGAGWGSALAAAQRELIKSPTTAHPYYWAGFELIGVQ